MVELCIFITGFIFCNLFIEMHIPSTRTKTTKATIGRNILQYLSCDIMYNTNITLPGLIVFNFHKLNCEYMGLDITCLFF